jgi:hypothetical protein
MTSKYSWVLRFFFCKKIKTGLIIFFHVCWHVERVYDIEQCLLLFPLWRVVNAPLSFCLFTFVHEREVLLHLVHGLQDL